VAASVAEIADSFFRPAVQGLVPYEPGKPVEEVQRELGLARCVKLASNEGPFGPFPAAVEALARSVPDSGGVTIVPALAGLGAPHWRPDARGLIAGITRGTTKAHIARAALEAIALQNVDLLRAMQADATTGITNLRVDGGAAANDLLMQLQADLSGLQIFRPDMVELTALGAAKLAARGIGLPRTDRGAETARVRIFNPNISPAAREEMIGRWHTIVGRA